MSQPSNTNAASAIPEVVKTLVDVRASDTVYGDLDLRRARELLGTVARHVPVYGQSILLAVGPDHAQSTICCA